LRRRLFFIGVAVLAVGLAMSLIAAPTYVKLSGPIGALARAFDPELQARYRIITAVLYSGIGVAAAGAVTMAYAAASKPESP